MKIILASASPRRKEILKKANFDFTICPSNYDEKISNLEYSKELVENCAQNKALDVLDKFNNDYLIISADTVVVLDNQILGKPKDKKEAFSMLNLLSNKTHFVSTSVVLLYKNKVIKGTEITHVTFRKLSEEDILNYIERFNPLDKAGSYGIQDKDFDFAMKLQGNFDNVIGFPMNLFNNLYNQLFI